MIQKCDLATFCSNWINEIPMGKDVCYAFRSENCPIPPLVIETEALIIKKTYRGFHPNYRVDAVEIFAKKETLRSLGLFLLASVFHTELPIIQINLINELSDIKTIYIESMHHVVCETPGFHTKPFVFNYWPNDVFKHPWQYHKIINPYDYPRFFLTNKDDFCHTDDDFAKRDAIRGFGGDTGTVLLAELLLNMSRDENAQDEFQLEGEGGFRGVGPMSCWVEIWLPGSFNWWGDIAAALE